MRDDLAMLADDLERAFFKLRLYRNQPAPIAIQRAVVMLRMMAAEPPTLWMVTDEDDPTATPVILFKAQAMNQFPYFTHPHVTELFAAPRTPMPHEKPFADAAVRDAMRQIDHYVAKIVEGKPDKLRERWLALFDSMVRLATETSAETLEPSS